MDIVTDHAGLSLTLPTLDAFKEDLRRQFRDDLRAAGYKIGDSLTARETAIRFHTIRLRWIKPLPRRVCWSKELLERTLPRDIDLALTTVENESIVGMDLNPRTSRKQRNAMFDDPLFYDWGVGHLHLGAPGGDKRGFAGGTSDLLFVKVTDETVYFLDVKDHEIFNTRCDEGFMEILHGNWPELIERYRMGGVRSLETKYTPEERVLIRKGFTVNGPGPSRKAFMSSFVELQDGTVYYPPGGSVSTKGSSNHAADWAIELFRAVHDTHQWCVTHADDLADAILQAHGTRPVNLRGLHLCLEGETFCLRHQPTGTLLRLTSGKTP